MQYVVNEKKKKRRSILTGLMTPEVGGKSDTEYRPELAVYPENKHVLKISQTPYQVMSRPRNLRSARQACIPLPISVSFQFALLSRPPGPATYLRSSFPYLFHFKRLYTYPLHFPTSPNTVSGYSSSRSGHPTTYHLPPL